MDVLFQGAEDGVEEEGEVRSGRLAGDGRDPGVLLRGDIGFGDQQGTVVAAFLEQEDVVADRIFVDAREVRGEGWVRHRDGADEVLPGPGAGFGFGVFHHVVLLFVCEVLFAAGDDADGQDGADALGAGAVHEHLGNHDVLQAGTG